MTRAGGAPGSRSSASPSIGREALGASSSAGRWRPPIAGATHGRQPVRRAQRHRGEARDQRACSPSTAAEGKLPAPRADGHLRGPATSTAMRAHLAHGDAGRLRRVLRLLRCATPARDALLTRLRAACRDRAHNATTVGYGPRFLHSTGQLHKGGAEHGRVPAADGRRAGRPARPRRGYTFATLRDAQALGDLQVSAPRPARPAGPPGRRHRRRADGAGRRDRRRDRQTLGCASRPGPP